MPESFYDYFTYLQKELKFGERPNYDQLIKSFEFSFRENGFIMDDRYEWVLHKQQLMREREIREAELKELEQLRRA